MEEVRETWERDIQGGMMFNQGRQVGFSNYQALVWVLYPKLNLSHLPPSCIEVGMFIIQLVVDLSSHLDIGSNTLYGLASQAKDSVGTSKTTKGLSLVMKEPVGLGNEEGQSSMIGS